MNWDAIEKGTLRVERNQTDNGETYSATSTDYRLIGGALGATPIEAMQNFAKVLRGEQEAIEAVLNTIIECTELETRSNEK